MEQRRRRERERGLDRTDCRARAICINRERERERTKSGQQIAGSEREEEAAFIQWIALACLALFLNLLIKYFKFIIL